MLDIAYGHTTTSADDELIMLADTVVREAMDTGSLAGTLIDFFPARVYPSISSMGYRSHNIERQSGIYLAGFLAADSNVEQRGFVI